MTVYVTGQASNPLSDEFLEHSKLQAFTETGIVPAHSAQNHSKLPSLLRTLYADLPLRVGEIVVAGYDIRNISRKF